MKHIYSIFILLFCLVWGFPRSVRAQSVDELEELADVSYIYAAVMGTGTYKIDDRRISMLSIPFAWTQRELTEEQAGIKWTLPVVLGYDALNYPDWLSRFLDDELVTLTVLPGFEVKQHLTEHWVFKPFGNIGTGYDFTRNETILMGILGIRGLGTWAFEDDSELRVGTAYRYAAEYQLEAADFSNFSLIESGVDYRRDAHLDFFSRDINVGVYYRFQLFVPEWRFAKTPEDEESNVNLIHEIGASTGLRHPFSILGIPISRVRLGYSFGKDVSGWSIGTDFPF